MQEVTGSESDSELVQYAREGNKAAFGVLVERYMPMVRRIAWRMISDNHVVQDIAQEAMLQTFLSLNTLRSNLRFKSWLYGITLNVCRAYLRGNRAVYSLENMLGGVHHAALMDDTTLEEIAERMELRRIILQALDTLSQTNRAAVTLFYYEGFDLHETAALLGISITAVKGRLHKARRQLQTHLMSLYNPIGVKTMIPVKVVDVISKTVTYSPEITLTHMQVVLFNETQRKAIVIWVGEAEGVPIALRLGNYTTPYATSRPMTPMFMSRLLSAAGATLETVEISALKENVFYATARIRVGDQIQEVDARPSDAIALALETNVPLFVNEDVMEEAGVLVPEGTQPTGKGVSNIVTTIDSMIAKQTEEWEKQKQEVGNERQPNIYEKTQAVLAEIFE